MSPQCITIGASAGGLEPLRDVVSQLPVDFPAPVFVVMHLPANHRSYLPEILSKTGPLPALHPKDNSKLEAGVIYVAPPDHHLLIDNSFIAVNRGPKENGFRPSVDALFRSAAYSYGSGAIGVVLSGALHDGASGLWSIKRLGGIAIVQEPYEAEYPSMPRSALEYVDADYRVRSQEIGPLLTHLAREQMMQDEQVGDKREQDTRRMAIETQIAAGVNLPEKTILELGPLTQFTCPECRGSLIRITEGNLLRFRCHTGHGFSAEALLEGLMETVDQLIWQTVRGSQEASMLLEHLGRHIHENGDSAEAERFLVKARELSQQATQLQNLATERGSLQTENARRQPDEDTDDL
ncbi:MAG TPA: chemotaxis protein CheB [Anaerolineales bacterium]|nr:chemotaxis protein CheB [Anaerolineales bacterium]